MQRLRFDLIKYFVPFTKYPYEGSQVACPVCASDHHESVSTLDRRLKRLPTSVCSHCGLLFTNPMPTDDELAQYYSRYYRLDYQGARDAPKQRHLTKRVGEAEARAIHIKPHLTKPARTLDFGCGTGEFVANMLAAGHDSHGFEPGETYGRYARENLGDRIRIQRWQEIDYPYTFDLITCFHVLEHLKDPVVALQRMVSWLSPEGMIYVEVPNMGSSLPCKGFGGLHFAHVIGFNHHNLLFAAHCAGLKASQVISDTGIVFRRGHLSDPNDQAKRGHDLAMSLFGNGNAARNYLKYQLSKIWGRPTSRAV
jgi:2-polyprenyl-3-methyl-5-hydroxy-6-metoxy-1,4-benzoquinol methylase